MEYGWKCFNDESVMTKRVRCKVTVIGVCLALFFMLMLAVTVSSYAAETLNRLY